MQGMKKNFYISPKSYDYKLSCTVLVSALVAFAALFVALVGQYFLALHPCELCIYQRIPYAVIVFLGLFAFYFVATPKKLYSIFIICALLFIADAGIAFYHVGVESGFFPAPDACSANSAAGQSLEEMRAAIMNAPLVSCKQAMAYIFGLSMAAWNFIYASAAALACAVFLFKRRKQL